MLDLLFLPVIASVLSILALVPLGKQIVQRNIIFVDLAVAQMSAAFTLWTTFLFEQGWLAEIGGFIGAFLCVLFVKLFARFEQREAFIGLLYIIGASFAVLGAGQNPHGQEKLLQLLAGDILWMDTSKIFVLAICAIGILLIQLFKRDWFRKDNVFFFCFALVVSLVVPILGLFLVFACLISPALWRSTFASFVAPILLMWLGLAVSWYVNLPSSTCIVILLSIYGIFRVFCRARLA